MKKSGRTGDRFLFLLPTSLVLLLIIVIPFLLSFYLSLTSWNGVSPRLEFVGLENFKEILTKPGFFTSLSFTCRISVVVVILVNTIGVLLAALLTNGLKGSSFFRAGYYLPGTMGGIVVGFIWQFILIQGFPAIGQAFHIPFFSQQWLGTTTTAFWGIVMVYCWQSIGFVMIIMIAALTSVPKDYIEAAVVDGAGYWRIFLQIKIPSCLPYLSTCLFWTVSSAFKMFDLNMSLTRGGPFGSTTSLSQLIYQDAFTGNRYGYATAEALVLFIIVFGITTIQNRMMDKQK